MRTFRRGGRYIWPWAMVATPLLLVIDCAYSLRRRLDRAFLRGVSLILAVLLGVMVLTSLYALVKITWSIQALTGDSLVGLEAAVALRGATREVQLELLRLRMEAGRQLSAASVVVYRQRASQLLVEYQSGAFDEGDKINTAIMKARLETFLLELDRIAGLTEIPPEFVEKADLAAKAMTQSLDSAYNYNRLKTRQSVDEASASARLALGILKVLWWSTAGFVALVFSLYLSYRWLSLSSDPET